MYIEESKYQFGWYQSLNSSAGIPRATSGSLPRFIQIHLDWRCPFRVASQIQRSREFAERRPVTKYLQLVILEWKFYETYILKTARPHDIFLQMQMMRKLGCRAGCFARRGILWAAILLVTNHSLDTARRYYYRNALDIKHGWTRFTPRLWSQRSSLLRLSPCPNSSVLEKTDQTTSYVPSPSILRP